MANPSVRPLGPSDKAGILLRVSSVTQAAEDKTSLAAQREMCLAEMGRFGVPVVREYEEAGISGGYYHARPDLLEALSALERGDFNVLVVAFLSRASRDREYQSVIRRRVHEAGGRFYSCDVGEIDENNPLSALFANLRGDFDEYERKLIRERTVGGSRRAADAGRQPSRAASPFGYHIVQKSDVIRGTYPPGTEGFYQVVEDEAAHVRNVFAWYAGGASIREVARRLWEAGARPKTSTSSGGTWPHRTVADMLTKTVYKGEATYGFIHRRTDDRRLLQGLPKTTRHTAPEGTYIIIAVPALIDAAVWEACQVRRKESQALLSGAPLLRQMLTGLASCANCGRRLHYDNIKTDKRPPSYRCTVKAKPGVFALGGCTSATSFPKEASERLVVQGIAALVTRREVIAAAIEEFTRTLSRNGEREAAQGRLRALEKRGAELKQKQSAAVAAQIAGVMAGVDASAYTSTLAGLQTDLRAVQGEMVGVRQAANTVPPVIDPEAVASFVARAMASVEAVLMSHAIPVHEKNAALRGIVDRVLLYRGEPPEGRKRNAHPGAAEIWLKPLFEGEGKDGQLCGTVFHTARSNEP